MNDFFPKRLGPGWLCSLALLVLCAAPTSAQALELLPGGVSLEILNPAGEADMRAGAHPDRLIQGIEFSNLDGSAEDLRDMVVDLPPGLSGDLGAVPACPRRDFDERLIGAGRECPPESQVGKLLSGSGEEEGSTPLYSVEPGPNEVALFGAFGSIPQLELTASLRPGDLGLSLRLSDVGQSSIGPPRDLRIELWGIPADHQEETSIPRKPLLTLPSRCDGLPLSSTVSAHTWQHPERWFSGSGNSGRPLTGCERLPFDPAVSLSLENPAADTPSGVGIDVAVPQSTDPDGLSSSQLKEAAILLPAGMTLSPGAAQGLSACADAQLGLGTSTEPSCPPSSRVGALEIEVPSLAKPMRGSIYLGSERPGERFRLFMAASSAGAQVKLAGALQPDPVTGRLTATLKNLPQAAFERMRLSFDGAPNAFLATPLACGEAITTATLTPYSAPSLTIARQATTTLTPRGGGPCGAPPFKPTLLAGSTSARAGRPTAFSTSVRRNDGEALPERLAITLPKGMSAALGAVAPCPPTAIASSTCPTSSKVGKAAAELGPGVNPAQIAGDIFLTGPYRHAPFGLAIAFRASLGPYELGTLSVRAAIRIDSQSGEVTIATDSLPAIFEGIPVRFQSLGLDLDRKGFIANPTSCVPTKVRAAVSSSTGTLANPSTPFALGGCIELPFKPKLTMALGQGPKPALALTTKLPAKGANLRSLQIELPKRLGLDSGSLLELCSRFDATHGKCPKGSAVGSAFARTPLLGQAMSGSLYLAQPTDNGPPDIWASLGGEGMQIELKGELAVKDGRAQTTFAEAPDFPLTRLGMRFFGGKHGLMELQGSACPKDLMASTRISGHNGALVRDRVPVGVRGRCAGGVERGR